MLWKRNVNKSCFAFVFFSKFSCNQSFEEGKSCCKILSQTQQCVCATDLCNKDFETAAPPTTATTTTKPTTTSKGDNDDDTYYDEVFVCHHFFLGVSGNHLWPLFMCPLQSVRSAVCAQGRVCTLHSAECAEKSVCSEKCAQCNVCAYKNFSCNTCHIFLNSLE